MTLANCPPVDRSRVPLVAGAITVKIETSGGYAYLDDHGRYSLKSVLDTATNRAGAYRLW